MRRDWDLASLLRSLEGKPPSRGVRGALALLVTATALSGCFSDILPAGPLTKLEFICAVLDPDEAERVVVHAWVGEDVDLAFRDADRALLAEIERIGAREGDEVTLRVEDGPAAPRRGWNETSLREWWVDRPFASGNEVHLHVLWVHSLGGGLASLTPAPGLVAVAQDAVREGAERMGRPEAEVARAVLLHAAGHALGAVNQGVPVQDTDLQEREGPPGHDPDPASVLHAGWEDAATMEWAANATYSAFPAYLHADWDAAVREGGVCAA